MQLGDLGEDLQLAERCAERFVTWGRLHRGPVGLAPFDDRASESRQLLVVGDQSRTGIRPRIISSMYDSIPRSRRHTDRTITVNRRGCFSFRMSNSPGRSPDERSEIRVPSARRGLPAYRGACHRAALRADPLAHAGYEVSLNLHFFIPFVLLLPSIRRPDEGRAERRQAPGCCGHPVVRA